MIAGVDNKWVEMRKKESKNKKQQVSGEDIDEVTKEDVDEKTKEDIDEETNPTKKHKNKKQARGQVVRREGRTHVTIYIM